MVEGVQLEAAGLPRETLAYLRAIVLALGLAGLASGCLFVLLDVALSGGVGGFSLRSVLGGGHLWPWLRVTISPGPNSARRMAGRPRSQ